jgi:hypothetical protein
MKCGGHCENVCLQSGQYHMKSHIFAIDMGGCDIVLKRTTHFTFKKKKIKLHISHFIIYILIYIILIILHNIILPKLMC